MGVTELCNQVLYYRRNVVTLPILKGKEFRSGDIIDFAGSLYSDEARTKLVGSTNIRYTIRAILHKQAIIHVGVNCTFQEGMVAFVGSLISDNFSLSETGIMNAYTTKVASLAVTSGTCDFEKVLGNVFFQINGPSEGVLILNGTIPALPPQPIAPIAPMVESEKFTRMSSKRTIMRARRSLK